MSERTGPSWWRQLLVASALALVVTVVLLPGVARLTSYRPVVGGCGEHQGLVIGTDVDVSPDFQRRALIRQWNSGKPPDQQATIEELTRSTDTTRSELAAALESRSCAYDVLLVDVAWLPEYAQRGFLTPVEDSWVENPSDFVPQVRETGEWDGRQYAVPWYTDAGLLYVRRGDPAPGTWDALLSGPYIAQLKDYEGLTVNALEVIWNTQEGPVLSGAVDQVTAGTAKVILRGLDRLAGATPHLPDSRGYAEDDSLRAFAARADAPMRNWPYAFRVLTADPRLRDDFDVTNLPGSGLSVLGGWDLGVSAYSRHKAEAGALIRFLTDSANQRQLFSCGGFTPPRNSAFENPAPCPDPKYRSDELPSPERFKAFATTLKAALYNARPRPITPYYAQFSETFRGCVTQVLDAANGRAGAHRPTPETLAKVLTAALHGRHGDC